ncbi:hypothetical protein B4119_0824 [Parageobacillus caldoxylosilyticus]|uniref:Uncharacterized protein n=1 Tax=Saccharococcus caldoxylosilyticus TaxID=81408 RepID=A0A150LDZ3_9BACL|nr:hypothetical protein B4119_0824 [Parageobacillus caldoxylosilyticus]
MKIGKKGWGMFRLLKAEQLESENRHNVNALSKSSCETSDHQQCG